jgi:hypothetical protein
MLRVDFIFSYWIFFWYILYIFNITNYNPKFIIICGLIANLIILFLMFYYKTNPKLIYLFVIMMCILKIIPIYTIWNSKIKMNDIFITIFLIILYLLWIFIHKKNINDYIINTKKLIIYNKNTLPGMQLLEKLGL